MAFRAFLFGCNTLGLRFVDNDINLMSQTLQSHGYGISKYDNQISLTDSINNFCDNTNPTDTVIIYFSGHAAFYNSKLFLVIKNEIADRFLSSTIHIENIITALENSKAKNKLIILDCCRAASAHKYKPDWSNSLKILASSDINDVSKEIEDKNHGFFTWMLCDLIQYNNGPFSLAGKVNLSALFQCLRKSIQAYNTENNTNHSIPKLHGEESIDFNIMMQKTSLDKYTMAIEHCYKHCTHQCFQPKPYCSLFNRNKAHYYIHPNLSYGDKCDINNTEYLSDIIACTVGNNSEQNTLLLGDSGSGKTSFCGYLLYQAAELYNNQASLFIPFYFQLADINNLESKKSLLALINEEYDLKISQAELQLTLKGRKILFILDGFDELSNRADANMILNNLKHIEHFYRKDSKVILTCRTHYFADDRLINEIMSGETEKGTDLLLRLEEFKPHTIWHLQELSLNQIRRYVMEEEPSNHDKILKKIFSIYNLSDLAKKPLLLHLICVTLPSLLKSSQTINKVQLYKLYVKTWIKREVFRKMTNITDIHKIEFMSAMAFEMWANESASMSGKELVEQITGAAGMSTVLTDTDVHGAEYDVRNSSFLNRDRFGNYKFMHRSFMEYFVAVKCLSEINPNANNLPSWSVRWLDQAVADFICQFLQLDENIIKIIELLSVASQSQDEILQWNALHIVSLLDKDVFELKLKENYLYLFGLASKTEENIVIIRQYCRIFAKFGQESYAKSLINKVIKLAKKDPQQNDYNNRTYIRYYHGQKSACEALLIHISSDIPKYDRLLHIYVLGQLGTVENISVINSLLEKWEDRSCIQAAKQAIKKIRKRYNISD